MSRKESPRFTVYGSRFTDHGSRFTVHASRITYHGSRFTAHGSRLAIVIALVAFLSFLTAVALLAAESGPAQSLKITRITPSGNDVPPGRQIVFEFDRPVVPLGRMERNASEIPITIEPALSCRWRWLNSSNLACHLDEQHAMAPATRYTVTVGPGIKSEDGAVLAEQPLTHSFITQRPKTASATFEKWLSPVQPQMSLAFDQVVRQDSVEAHAFFRAAPGLRVGAKVQADDRYDRFEKPGLHWLLSPVSDLPPDKVVQLLVEPGIQPVTGNEPGIENRAVFSLQTLGQFRFVGVQCTDLAGASSLIRAESRAPKNAPQTRCNPQERVMLLFTSPVAGSELRSKVAVTPVEKGEPAGSLWPEFYQTASWLRFLPEKGRFFKYELEEGSLRPFSSYRIHVKAKSLKDEFGRPITGAVDAHFETDHLPPELYLYKGMSVLEKGLDTDLPVFAANIDGVDLRYETFTAAAEKSAAKTVTLPGPRVHDELTALPLGVRKLIPAESGVLTGTVSPRPSIPRKTEYPDWNFLLAQVTPFHVHVKVGHFNTLVWVTDFQTGEPVPGVSVEVRKDSLKNLGAHPEALSRAVTDSNGLAELAGTSQIDPDLKDAEGYGRADSSQGLLVLCRKGSDVALAPMMYPFRVDSEGANYQYIPSGMKLRHGHIAAWGATAQGIYKLGDTVQYKIYVRDQENRRFIQPPAASYTLKVMDPTSRVVYQRDKIELSEFGAMNGEFPIPKNGAVGYYNFHVEPSFAKLDLEPLKVLVSDFTPSPFRVTTDLNGNIFGAGESVTVSTQAKLHAGGPYGGADLGVTATVEPQDFRPDNPLARDFQFDVVEKTGREEGTGETRPEVQTVFQTKDKLDSSGNSETRFTLAELPVYYGRLTVESSVKDERGKSVASRATAACFSRERFVGLDQQDWVLTEGSPARVAFIVTDQTGKTVPGAQVKIEIQSLRTRAARVKGAGDAYPTQYEQEWVPVETMSLSSGDDPQTFEFTPKSSGTLRIVAAVSDPKGREQKTGLRRWVAGKSFVLWRTEEGNLLNIYPDKEQYRVGDTARIFVQNPYPGAKALVTVERYGVLDHWVKTLEHSAESIEVPVLPDYLPGFYVSVTVMSPRVAKPLGPGGEDLGKPAFRIGYAQIEVKDQFKEIEVKCNPDREVYKPRDTVKLQFEARPKNISPGDPAQPIELAVAVLDESVFDLLRGKRDAFDPYGGFYKLDELDMVNYNLIMQLVGRDKLEKKGGYPAAAAGFDLGMRSVFKFVSYWNPSIRVDAQGRANVEFQLPDNLTGWRVLAMAVSPGDRMGLGEAVFKVNQLTEIRPVLPNQVLEGDAFSAGFSVMNRTAESRNIEVKIAAAGPVVPGKEPGRGQSAAAETVRTIAAEPYKRYTVRLPLKAVGKGEIVFTVQAGDDKDRDAFKHVLKVLPRVNLSVAAAYDSILAGEGSQKIEFPADMRPESSLLKVGFSPSILSGLEGPFHFMKVYPFECWEQKISRAVMAGAAASLAPWFSPSFSWQNAPEEADRILAEASEFQAPNGGMAFYEPRDDYVSPFLSAFTAKAFNWLKESGHTPPAPVEEKLTKYLLDILKRDQTHDVVSKSVLSDVRALALSALADNGRLSRADLERLHMHRDEMSLFGLAMFLDALGKEDKESRESKESNPGRGAPDTLEMRKEVLAKILAHSDQTSGTLRFTEQRDSALRSILCSQVRDNAAILMAFLSCGAPPSAQGGPGQFAGDLGDIPQKLMATIASSRKGLDHWASTQENLFAAMAAVRYGKTFETGKPQLSFQALLDRQPLGRGKFENLSDKPLTFEYRPQTSDMGRKADVTVRREGEGRLYYDTVLAYEPAETSSDLINAGIEIHREYSVERDGKWAPAKNPVEVRTGDLVRVDLFVSLPSERFFVVVVDPVPGGLEPVNRELATSSDIDAQKGEYEFSPGSLRNRFTDWLSFGLSRWTFYHRELRHDSARFYSERLGAGHYYLSYTAQAIAPGQFAAPPARAEEMYEPDVYGKSAPAVLKVELAE
ncbi:MAG TPA: MG2 domain-containing protein [Syntrophobacteraceae bacterium]|nr:MG2 domain-containing protein [Syntrophobacteraceae bacterium]